MPDKVRDQKPEERIAYYRDAAKRARAEAERESKPEYKAALLTLADSWERLAVITERDITLF